MRSEKKARRTLGLEARRYVARQGRKGRSYRVIAREMGVSRTQVRNICSRAEAEGEVREGRKRGRRPTRIGPGLPPAGPLSRADRHGRHRRIRPATGAVQWVSAPQVMDKYPGRAIRACTTGISWMKRRRKG